MKDKIIATKGYCMLVTDEGAGFFDDIQKKQKNHESDLSMLNQLFDGKGDRMMLAQNKERIVPPNSTSISIGMQEESFCEVLADLGKDSVVRQWLWGTISGDSSKTFQESI